MFLTCGILITFHLTYSGLISICYDHLFWSLQISPGRHLEGDETLLSEFNKLT